MKASALSTAAMLAVAALFSMTAPSVSLRAAEPAPSGEMTVHVIPQAHIDLAWWWRYWPHTVKVVVTHTLETAFDNMDKYPDYTFAFLQVPAIEPLEDLYPGLYYKLHYFQHVTSQLGERIWNPQAQGDGRLEIASAAWDEFDGSLPCGESVVRQLMYGKRYYKDHFGVDVKTVWCVDAWTHPWTYPQIFKKSGIENYFFTRGGIPNDEKMFWWEAPDGSRVLTVRMRYPDGILPSRQELDKELAELWSRYGVRDLITLIGVGNHGGGALRADVETMKAIMQERETAGSSKPAAVQFSKPSTFEKALKERPGRYPVFAGEITPTIRGVYTTAGGIKDGNRRSECLLMSLEKFSALAWKMGALERYPQGDIFDSWKKVMLNQFHDTISGTDIPPAQADALQLYQEVLQGGQEHLERALGAIAAQVDTRGEGVPLVVFNPLAWRRSGPVEASLELDGPVRSLRLSGPKGEDVPVQITARQDQEGSHRVSFVFLAREVPSLGYSLYRVFPDEAGLPGYEELKATPLSLENGLLRLSLNPATGNLKSVYDKAAGRESLAGGEGNRVQIIEDYGDSEGFLDNRDLDHEHLHTWDGPSWDTEPNPEIKLIESGPVRAVLRVKQKYGLARLTQEIILYAGSAQADFRLFLDWEGRNKMVKVAFPLNVKADQATYEIPYGTISRQNLGQEQNAQQWADLSAGGYGASLVNDNRYGYDIRGSVVRLSVLRSPDHPSFVTDEAGVHRVGYALYPHRGDWRGAGTVKRGYELNNPLIARAESVHGGGLPAQKSFLSLEPENVILTVLKKAEDSDDLVLRLYESAGKACTARLSLACPFDAVYRTNLLENSLEALPHDSLGFSVPVGAWAIESFRLLNDPQ